MPAPATSPDRRHWPFLAIQRPPSSKVFERNFRLDCLYLKKVNHGPAVFTRPLYFPQYPTIQSRLLSVAGYSDAAS